MHLNSVKLRPYILLCWIRETRLLGITLTHVTAGFSELCENQNPFIIGGGAGIPPLYGLAKRLIEKNITPKRALFIDGTSPNINANKQGMKWS